MSSSLHCVFALNQPYGSRQYGAEPKGGINNRARLGHGMVAWMKLPGSRENLRIEGRTMHRKSVWQPTQLRGDRACSRNNSCLLDEIPRETEDRQGA